MSVGLERELMEPSQPAPPIEVEVKGWGVVEFPADTPRDEMKRALDARFRPDLREEGDAILRGATKSPPAPSFPTDHPMVTNADGTQSNVRMGSFTFDDRTYALPTMVGGRQLSDNEAVALARQQGLDKYPSFSSVEEAESWISKNHGNISQPSEPRSWGGWAADSYRDTGVTTLKGLASVPQTITGVADMMPLTDALPGGTLTKEAAKLAAKKAGIPLYGWSGWVQQRLGIRYEDAQQALHKMYSPETQEAYREVEEAEGILGKTQAALQNPSMILTTVGEAIPTMAVGGAIGKAVKGTGLVSKSRHGAAIGEGLMAAGSGAEQTRAQSPDGLLTEKQVAINAGSGVLTALIGTLGGKLAARLGVDDIDVLLAGGTSQGAKRNVLIRVLAGALIEGGVEEAPQSVQEQIASNLANSKPWHEGWDQALVVGALSGGVMGGGTNLRGLADLSHAPTRREWAKVVLGDISRYRESPNRTTRRQQHKAAVAAKQEEQRRGRLPEGGVDATDRSGTGLDRGTVPAPGEENVPTGPSVAPPGQAGQPSVQDRGAVPAVTGAEPEGREGVKEPWEMTYNEVLAAVSPGTKEELEVARPILKILYAEEMQDRTDPWGIVRAVERGDEIPRTPTVELSQRHRAVIKQALSEGKPVPPEVLADYPDLAPQAPQAPPTASVVPGGPGTRSAQHAYTEAQRALYGFGPRVPEIPHDWVKAHAEAMAKTDAEVTAVADRIKSTKGTPDSDTEVFMLVRRMNEIENRHAEALQRGDMNAVVTAEMELIDIDRVLEKSGSMQGKAFNARKAWIKNDNSLLGSLRRAAKKKGAPLTTAERQELAELRQKTEAQEAQLAEVEKHQAESAFETVVSETTAKRRETLKSRYEKVVDAITEAYGIHINFGDVEAEAKRRAGVEAEAAREFNQAYDAAVEATGLTPAKIGELRNAQFLGGGKTTDINEYGGLDETAPMLARDPEVGGVLGIKTTPADAEQTGTEAADLVDVLSKGRKQIPEWHDKLYDIASAMAAEQGVEIPEREVTEGSADEFDTDYEDDFDWGTGEFRKPETKPAGKPKKAKPPTAREKADLAKERRVARVAELKDSYFALGSLKFAEPRHSAQKYARFRAALYDTVIAYIEEGVRSFNAAVVKLAADMGVMNPELRQSFRGEWDRALGEGAVPSPVRDPSDNNELGRFAQRLVRWVVESGVTDTKSVLDEVHAELQTIRPGITRSEAMRAACGYGEFKELSKDDVSMRTRAIRGELQQHSKIEDLEKAIAEAKRLTAEGKPEAEIAAAVKEFLPKKTGVEQRTPGQTERDLISQVNELKTKIPVSVEATERQLKTTLETAKTAVRNRIEDLKAGRGRKERTPGQTDAELDALRKQRDELQAIYDELNPRASKPLTPEQQLDATERGLDRAIDTLEEDLGRGIVGRPGKPVSRTSPEIELKRKKLARLRQIREDIRELDPKFQKDEDARLLAGRKQMLKKRLADYEDRWERQDFAKKPIRKSPEDAETLKIRHQVSEARERQRAAEDRIAKANWPAWRKAVQLPLELRMAFKAFKSSFDSSFMGRQGVLMAMAHPLVAARTQVRSTIAMVSPKEAFAIQEDIAKDPFVTSGMVKQSGLELTSLEGGLITRPEEYQSTLAEKIPIVGIGIGASERAFIAQGNQQRLATLKSMVAFMCRDPGNPTQTELRTLGDYVNRAIAFVFPSGGSTMPTEGELRALGNFVNIESWRGDVLKFQATAAHLGQVFWAPRGRLSRFQYVSQWPLIKATLKGEITARAAKTIAWEEARTLGGMLVFTTTAAGFLLAAVGLPGDDERKYGWNLPSLNPGSPDFFKLRIGRRRIDFGGGIGQTTRLIRRMSSDMVNGLRKLAGGKVSKKGRENMRTSDMYEGRYFRSMFTPDIALAHDIKKGETYMGKDLTRGKVVEELTVPLSLGDIYDALREGGIPEDTAMVLSAWWGLGVTYYEPKRKKPPPY